MARWMAKILNICRMLWIYHILKSKDCFRLQRMRTSLFISILAMVTAALVRSEVLLVTKNPSLINVYYLVPHTSVFLLGSAVEFKFLAQFEFFWVNHLMLCYSCYLRLWSLNKGHLIIFWLLAGLSFLTCWWIEVFSVPWSIKKRMLQRNPAKRYC